MTAEEGQSAALAAAVCRNAKSFLQQTSEKKRHGRESFNPCRVFYSSDPIIVIKMYTVPRSLVFEGVGFADQDLRLVYGEDVVDELPVCWKQ